MIKELRQSCHLDHEELHKKSFKSVENGCRVTVSYLSTLNQEECPLQKQLGRQAYCQSFMFDSSKMRK